MGRLSAVSLIALSLSNPKPMHSQVNQQHPPGGFIDVSGGRLWYESEGTGQSLILIAGGPGLSHSYLHPYFAYLSKHYKVIHFDAYGCGKSSRARSVAEYTFASAVQHVEDLGAWCRSSSWALIGGMVAQAYALRFSHSVSKLVLMNTLYSAEMYQAGIDNVNREAQNQFPEVWNTVQSLRNLGYRGPTVAAGFRAHKSTRTLPLLGSRFRRAGPASTPSQSG
jgi:proline iminopeptidase